MSKLTDQGLRVSLPLLVVLSASLFSPIAVAQEERAPCPDLSRPGTPAEQALCWYDLDASDDSRCSSSDRHCLRNAAAWCDDAALDNPRVADGCLISFVRMGDFDTAREITEYLSEPSPLAERCRDSVTRVVQGRVVTNPSGGSVTVDGQTYGAAPVGVQLQNPWWTRRIVVDFDGSAVEVRPEAVAAAFDAQACQMGDIVVEGPVAPAVAVPVDATTPAVVDVGSDDDRARGSPLTPIGWGLTIGGGVMGLAALATGLVAEAIYQDLRSTCGTTSCPVESEGDISLGSALATTSTVLTFAGLAILVTGIVLLIMAPSDESEDAPSEPVVRVIPGPGVGLGGEVRF